MAVNQQIIPYTPGAPAPRPAFDPTLPRYLSARERALLIKETARQQIAQALYREKASRAVNDMGQVVTETLRAGREIQAAAAALRAQPLPDAEAQARYREFERTLLDKSMTNLVNLCDSACREIQHVATRNPLPQELPPRRPQGFFEWLGS